MRVIGDFSLYSFAAILRFSTSSAVKGGVKLDHWGGVKVDQYSMVEDQGLSGRRASGAEACAACKAARLGRSGRRPPPRGAFAAAGRGRELRRAVGGSGVRR